MATTSWGKEARWYDEHLADPDSYHAQVILPNLSRIMDLKLGERVLDVACGTGFFSKEFVKAGAKVIGLDIGKELIAVAQKAVPEATFIVGKAHELSKISDQSIDKISLVLAIQNIKEVRETFAECKRVLVPTGKLVLVMNHPVLRIPKGSQWGFDEETKEQYRRIDSYMTERTLEMDMHPGKNPDSKTISFHRPLQFYGKALSAAGLAITRLEEWISHKKSEAGPRQKEEDRMRKEIPLFMMIEARPF
jgi:ubiquinone/menaquinone biosynthesis C-methylase UbiE